MSEGMSGGIEFGFNVVGHPSGNFGLAVACRNTLRALTSRGERLCVLDVDAGGGRSGHDRTYDALACSATPAPHAVNLLHLNPPDVVNLHIDDAAAVRYADRLNLAVPFYELPRLPQDEWVPLLDNVDLVLAPSLHIRDAVERSCPHANVRHYPQAVFLPDGVSADRGRWGLPAETFVCLVAMDVSSDVERKNPWAAIDAFDAAFPAESGENVLLAVKLNNAKISRRYERDGAELIGRLAKNARVRVFDESLPYVESLSLTAACDAYLSLHRAEGLGLNLMEAMSLGKPVVATGWSGNMDFMTAENSCAVAYRLVDVATEHPSYRASAAGAGQQWAEPEVADAARSLRALFDDRPMGISLGARAAADMDAARVSFLRAEWVDQVARLWESGAAATAEHAARAAALETLKRPGAKRVLRRRVGKALKRLGVLR